MGWVATGLRWVLVALASALAAAACVDGGGGGKRPPVETFCETDCQLWAACTEQGPAAERSCYEQCLAVGWTLRGDVMEQFGNCLVGLGCGSLEQRERDECFYEAFESAAPSAACARYCEPGTHKAFECGLRYGIDACVAGNCGVVDSVLDEAAACHAIESCEDWATCLDGAFSVG